MAEPPPPVTRPTPLPEALVPVVMDPSTVTSLPDLARLVAAVETIGEVVSDASKTAREVLKARAIEDADGEGVTRRITGVGQVIVSNPQPTPYVEDQEAFAAWFEEHWPAQVVRQNLVTVHDHEAAAAATTFEDLRGALSFKTETLLPAKALEDATKALKLKVVEAGDGWLLIDPESGEDVPGVGVKPPGAQTLTVRPDKAAREAAVASLRADLKSTARRALG